jgi:hypothetical protein
MKKMIYIGIILAASIIGLTQANARAAENTSFGIYVIQPQFAAIERKSNTGQNVVTELGSLQVVKNKNASTEQGASRVQTNTVVRNLISGDLGVMTGRLTILTNNSATLTDAINALGLKKVKTINHGAVVMVEVPAGVDLLSIQARLKAVIGVREVKLDVLDNLLKPQ